LLDKIMGEIFDQNICLRCGENLKYTHDDYAVNLKYLSKLKTAIYPIEELSL